MQRVLGSISTQAYSLCGNVLSLLLYGRKVYCYNIIDVNLLVYIKIIESILL